MFDILLLNGFENSTVCPNLSFRFEYALENGRCQKSMLRSLIISDHFIARKVRCYKKNRATNLRKVMDE